MSGITSLKADRTTAVFSMVFLCICVLGQIPFACNVMAATAENDASYESPAAGTEAETVGLPEAAGVSLMFYATISTVVASVAALTVAAIAFGHVAKTNKRMSQIPPNTAAIGQQQKLAEAEEMIATLEYRLDSLEKKINDTFGQWDQHIARLNTTAAETERTGRRLSQNDSALQHVNGRVDAVSQDIATLKVSRDAVVEDIETLKNFRDAVKSLRDRIVDVINPELVGKLQMAAVSKDEPADSKEESAGEVEESPSEADEGHGEIEQATDLTEDTSSDMMKYYYPDGAGSGFSG